MSSPTSQQLESFVPVYDTVPEKWEDARQFLVEHLKKISNAVNIREIGWLLDEELLNGQQFIPTIASSAQTSGTSQQYRGVLRKVIDVSPIPIDNKSVPHGILFDVNFTLLHIYGAETNSVTLQASPITFQTIAMDATNINITSTVAYDRGFVTIEYIQEI